MPKTRRLGTTSAALAAALLLGACSSSPKSDDHVATLASNAPASAAAGDAAGDAADSRRPQLRLDTTEEERTRLFTVYNDCLIAHGVKVLTAKDQAGPVAAVDGSNRVLDPSGKPKAAYVACAAKLPLEPPELDEATNPNYNTQWNDNVKCLRAHGLMVHVTKPGEWTYDSSDTAVPDNEEQLEKSCLIEAFGHGS
jgi:hypothetical protein